MPTLPVAQGRMVWRGSETAAKRMNTFFSPPLDLEAAAPVKAEFVFEPLIGEVGDQDGSRLAEQVSVLNGP